MPDAWRMHAERNRDGMLLHLGDRRYAQMYAGTLGGSTVVEVSVREVPVDDAAGTHWGWLRAGRSEPEMVWPRRFMLDMCFEYGVDVEERKGAGRVVRLAVTEVADA